MVYFFLLSASNTERNLHNKYREFRLCTVISTCLEYSLVFQLINHVQLFATLWTAARQAPLSSPVSRGLLKFMSTELVLLSNHLILCRPLLLPSIPASALCIRWPEYWSFNNNPSNEYSGLISFRIGWFDLAVQETSWSSLAPQFESINSLAFSFLYVPALTSVHDYWKNSSFDYTNLCWQSNVFAF